MTIINRICSFSLIFIIFSCTHSTQEQQIVLKINNLEVTLYELQKQARRQLQNTNRNKTTIEAFKQSFIKKNLIIADAYQKKYDTVGEINRNVYAISDIMMVQQDGYLWNKNVLPGIEERIEITPEKLSKRGKVFYFDIIQIDDLDSLQKTFEVRTKNYDDFKELKKLCENNSGLSHSFESLQWPFKNYHPLADTLFNMKENTISELLKCNEKYYYFFLQSVDLITVTPDDEELLKYHLLYLEEDIASKSKKKEMLERGEPKIYEQSVTSIHEFLKTGEKLEWYPHNDTLVSYAHNNNIEYILFNDFIEPRKYYPFFKSINSKEELEDNIMQCYYSAYLKYEAQHLGLYSDKTFLLDQKNYKNQLIYDYYVKKEITNNIIIDSSEVIEYYSNNPELFTESKYIYANCYFFNTEEEADNNWMKLTEFYKNNSADILLSHDEIPSLQQTILNYKIDKEGYADFIPEDIYKVKNLMPGQVSYSVAFKGSYALLVDIREEGEYLVGLSDVYKGIQADLFSKETNRLIQLAAEGLKTKYPIELEKIDVDALYEFIKDL